MLWCPQKSFGIFVLTNVMTASVNAAPAIAIKALERHIRCPANNWIGRPDPSL